MPEIVARTLDYRGRLDSPHIVRGGAEPMARRLPNITKLHPLQLSDAELLEVLEAYGVLNPGPIWRQQTAGWLSRLWNLAPNSPRVRAELDRLAGEIGGPGLLETARHVERQYATQAAVGDNPEQNLIRIPEDFEASRLCDACAELAGEEGTLEYHQKIGMPGAASCYGGERCRCQLFPAD